MGYDFTMRRRAEARADGVEPRWGMNGTAMAVVCQLLDQQAVLDWDKEGPPLRCDFRQRLLSLLGDGRTVTEAAATAGISTTTVANWVARGRAADADPEAAAFAATYDACRRADSPPTEDGERLTVDSTFHLLEQSARKGSVTAQRAVLAELRRRQDAEDLAETLRGMGLAGR